VKEGETILLWEIGIRDGGWVISRTEDMWSNEVYDRGRYLRVF